jgi:hypothetical protein
MQLQNAQLLHSLLPFASSGLVLISPFVRSNVKPSYLCRSDSNLSYLQALYAKPPLSFGPYVPPSFDANPPYLSGLMLTSPFCNG